MSLTDALQDAGSVVVGPFASLEGAIRAIKSSQTIDAAVLNVNLGGRMIQGAGAGGAVCRFHLMAMRSYLLGSIGKRRNSTTPGSDRTSRPTPRHVKKCANRFSVWTLRERMLKVCARLIEAKGWSRRSHFARRADTCLAIGPTLRRRSGTSRPAAPKCAKRCFCGLQLAQFACARCMARSAVALKA
jgi:hypothetical protein